MPSPQERPSILVVEDEPDNADLMVRALRKMASVELCADGASAVERVQDGRFLAVVADQRLPGLTGVELLERVARISPHTERILVSGHADAQMLTDAINRGNVGHFLPKPIAIEELQRLIARLIASSAPSTQRRALVIAQPDVIETVVATMTQLGIPCDRAPGLAEAKHARRGPARSGDYELIVWDTATVRDALAALPDVQALAPDAGLVCVGGTSEAVARAKDAPRLLRAGVDDVIWRPLRAEELAVRIRRVLDRRELLRETARLRRSGPVQGVRELIGSSAPMREIFDVVERVAIADVTVLVRGETGTGKELVARVIHALSLRRDRPFVSVNCAALPETLVESELFGHERGAFTGATARRPGRFERADGGTLFIDEVGDVPLPVQVKLLRALQERAFERIGGNDTLEVNIRLIAATNRNLEELIEQGRFREDLFYRLNVVPVTVPPLRDRTDDIWPLAEHYLAEYQRRLGKEGIRVSERMRGALEGYAWPGNVRELMNVLERAVALTPSHGVADIVELPPRAPRQRFALAPSDAGAARPLKELLSEYERRIVAQTLERHHGNRSRAARDLGISRQALGVKLAKWGS